jgi:hypothetical protein
MQHHWPGADEQPTPKANLTIEEVRLLAGDLAGVEQPTLRAYLRIELVPPPEKAGAEPPAA